MSVLVVELVVVVQMLSIHVVIAAAATTAAVAAAVAVVDYLVGSIALGSVDVVEVVVPVDRRRVVGLWRRAPPPGTAIVGTLVHILAVVQHHYLL